MAITDRKKTGATALSKSDKNNLSDNEDFYEDKRLNLIDLLSKWSKCHFYSSINSSMY